MPPILRHSSQPMDCEHRAPAKWLKVRPAEGCNALFTCRKGGHLTREQICRIFRQHAESAGLPREK